jgi:predicted nucleic acid-binding Zn ribbon protein
VTRHLGGPSAQVLTAVFAHWEELVGTDIAAHATPKSLRDGVLTVVVDHSAWATQLRYMGVDLVASISSQAAGDAVQELRVVVGGEPERAPRDDVVDGSAVRRRRSFSKPFPRSRRSRW